MALLSFILLSLSRATPLLFAAFGGLLSETSGVINFALEGMMLTGAFSAVWAAHASGSPWVGLAAGAAGGMLVGLLHAVACLKLRANQIVSSIALNLLASGATGMLLNQVFGVYGTSPSVEGLPSLNDLFGASQPGAHAPGSAVLEGISVLDPLAIVLGLAIIGLFRWSSLGRRIRACGENPLAAGAAGLSVFRIRFCSIVAGGALAGVGGAYLSIGELSQFVELMTNGRGYIAIAAIILGRWRPVGVFLAVFLFGMSEALSELLAVNLPRVPAQAFAAFPYFVCLIVLVLYVSRKKPPSALGRL